MGATQVRTDRSRLVIDLHTHILPGLDDGPVDLPTSLAMARHAANEGIETVVATPHIRADYRFPLELIQRRVAELSDCIAREGIPVSVLGAGELAVEKALQLDTPDLVQLTLGGRYLLIEAPYVGSNPFLESALAEVQRRGFVPVLAHPERSPSVASNRARLAALVERGVLVSVTAGSIEGRFGRAVHESALDLLRTGLVHNVASDAHDDDRRPPTLRSAFAALGGDLRGLRGRMDWLTGEVPSAIVAGQEIPARPNPWLPRSGLLGALRGSG